MHSDLINRKSLTAALLAAVACSCTALGSVAQGRTQGQPRASQPAKQAAGDPREHVLPEAMPGELMIRLAPGADAAAIAARHGVQVKKRLRFAPDTYVLSGVEGDLRAAAEVVGRTPGVLAASRNTVFQYSAFPRVEANDPLRSRQFALQVMNAPSAWGVTVGERFENGPRRSALVAVIDSPIDTNHPELAPNIDPNGFDFSLDAPYDPVAARFHLSLEPHGSMVAGCVAPLTNNLSGIAGLPWEGVRILPCQIGDLFFDTNSNRFFSVPNSASIVDAIYFCIQQQVDVINMSFGSAFADALIRQAVIDAYNQGIVMCASSGNGRFFGRSRGVSFPAAFPEVIAIGAVGPSGELAFYSDGGPELELMGPGGNDSTSFDFSKQVVTTRISGQLSTGQLPAGFAFTQGTSFSSPYVAGAVATLITQGAIDESLTPVEQVERIRHVLRRTARTPFGTRNNDFGFGIVNLDGALREFTHHIDVISPAVGEITASFAEPLQARIIRPRLRPDPTGAPGAYLRDTVPLADGEFSVSQNGSDVTGETRILDAVSGLIEYEPNAVTRYGIGNNRLNVVADSPFDPDGARSLEGDPNGLIPGRLYQFRVLPRVIQAGLQFMSVPYALQDGTDSLSFLFGGNLIRLGRWLPDRNEYAVFDAVGSPQDPEAALTTADAGVARAPVGVGFWARVVSPTQTQILGRSERSSFYAIPLRPGFNMIGNPFPFRVPFNVLSVRFGNEFMSIGEAVSRNLIRNTIYRYQDGRYSFQVLPNGELVEWEAHWVRALRSVDLIVPRVPSVLGQASAAAAPAGGGSVTAAGWKSTLRASVGSDVAAEVVFGKMAGAAEAYGPEDVETPPALPGKVDMRIRNRGWGAHSGAYVQDLRRPGRHLTRWSLEVETFEAGKPVKLSWEKVPPGTRAFLQVEGDRRLHSMATATSVSFTPARAGVRRVTVVTMPGAGT